MAVTGPKRDPSPEDSLLEAPLYAMQPDVLTLLPSSAPLSEVELTAGVRADLAEVLEEHRHRGRLASHRLTPRNRLFLHGPPGCGKTLTARALGRDLGLPVYVVRFDTLVGSYLGQTSLRIREVFRFAEATQCVLLIDEIDAVGRRRGKISDVGELDRVVISLMQQLDLVRPAGLLVAASNLPEELDKALLRRFDLALEFPMPTAKQLRAFADAETARRGLTLSGSVRARLARATSYAAVQQGVENAHRRHVLEGV